MTDFLGRLRNWHLYSLLLVLVGLLPLIGFCGAWTHDSVDTAGWPDWLDEPFSILGLLVALLFYTTFGLGIAPLAIPAIALWLVALVQRRGRSWLPRWVPPVAFLSAGLSFIALMTGSTFDDQYEVQSAVWFGESALAVAVLAWLFYPPAQSSKA